MSFQADYYDGSKARQEPVLVRVAGHAKNIAFDVNGETLTFNFADLEVQSKLGSARRLIDLPNGGRLEAYDISTLEAAMPSKTSSLWRWLHYLENHLGWVLVALVATVFVGWMFLQFGVPKLAEYVAKATPPAMEEKIGEQALEGLDSKFGYFSPSKTAHKRQADIGDALKTFCAATKNCPNYRLEFRAGGMIGANAFALPGGIMVVTDELVTLSENDSEIIAVLAHELGHVKQRHAFRQSLQGVLAGLVLAAVTGDVSSVGSGLPAVLMQMRYSREHELEADGFALKALQKACLPPKAFADILLRLQNQAVGAKNPDEAKKEMPDKTAKTTLPPKDKDFVSEMLATHPDTQARIKPFLVAKQNCN